MLSSVKAPTPKRGATAQAREINLGEFKSMIISRQIQWYVKAKSIKCGNNQAIMISRTDFLKVNGVPASPLTIT